jgi:hypothetical protein
LQRFRANRQVAFLLFGFYWTSIAPEIIIFAIYFTLSLKEWLTAPRGGDFDDKSKVEAMRTEGNARARTQQ